MAAINIIQSRNLGQKFSSIENHNSESSQVILPFKLIKPPKSALGSENKCFSERSNDRGFQFRVVNRQKLSLSHFRNL